MSEYRICIIGAGFSGIAVGVQLVRKLGVCGGFVIYDEQEDVGGVWQANTYPGCSADVPGPGYSYSFAPNPGKMGLFSALVTNKDSIFTQMVLDASDWSGVYAKQNEIQAYLTKVASEYNLYKSLRFKHRVTRLAWNEQLHVWNVSVWNLVTGEETHEVFDIVINCLGNLRYPNVPAEFQNFAGPCMHSAEWDHSVDLSGKTVAVVGNGSSGAQIIPAIVKRVKHLIVYQRNPTWMIPKPEIPFPALLRAAMRYIPGMLRSYRAGIHIFTEAVYPVTFIKSLRFCTFEAVCRAHLWLTTLGVSDLRKKLTPDYTFGCKPPSFSYNYFFALRKRNVELVRSPVAHVTKDSVTSEDGVERKVDVLILATGFRAQDYFSPLNITAKGGMDLFSVWKKHGPSLYMGVTSSLAPNLFWVAGPNTYAGYSSVIFAVEIQVKYILKIIKKLRGRGDRVVNVKESVEQAYMTRMLKALSSTVWASGDCKSKSYFSDGRGVVTAFNPYSFVTRRAQMRKVREEDFDFYNHDDDIIGTKL